MKRFVILLIKTYQFTLSPLVPPNTCRFYPTCSNYSVEAFSKHDLFKACWLTVKRIGRCHPWHPGGFDPVP